MHRSLKLFTKTSHDNCFQHKTIYDNNFIKVVKKRKQSLVLIIIIIIIIIVIIIIQIKRWSD